MRKKITREEQIAEIIKSLDETEKTVLLTLIFNNFNGLRLYEIYLSRTGQ